MLYCFALRLSHCLSLSHYSILAQMDTTTEGRTFCERYSVHEFPHVSIIDPRTGRLMWRKEGWTQASSTLTAEVFAEMAMDFCSRHSFDKPPAANPHKRKSQELAQAALQASLTNNKSTTGDDSSKEEEEEEEVAKEPSFVETLLAIPLPEEPASGGARIQIRMPDAKRLVRKFDPQDTVKSIYVFVAVRTNDCFWGLVSFVCSDSNHILTHSHYSILSIQQSNEEAKGGKEFTLSAGFPPKDLLESIDATVESCGLAGEAITVRWKN